MLGIGLSSYVEVCGVAPSKWIGLQGEGWGAGLCESANVKVHLTGKVVVTTGSQPHGQGHETTFAQLVADELGIPYDDIEIEHSDTLGTPFGYRHATAAARWRSVASAIHKSIDQDQREGQAARRAPARGEPGRHRLRGRQGLREGLAGWRQDHPGNRACWPALPTTCQRRWSRSWTRPSYYDPPNCTFPFGTHICVVEVDRDTGHVVPIRYVAVDDVGNVLNPLIVDGQVHGGIAQGMAQALYEGAYYDDDGQLITGSLNDYAVPTASMLPNVRARPDRTPSPVNAMGVKGAGEAGTIASTPAVANAVIDAVKHLDVKHIDMPLTPERVWRALNPS